MLTSPPLTAGTKSIDDALELRRPVPGAFERAEVRRATPSGRDGDRLCSTGCRPTRGSARPTDRPERLPSVASAVIRAVSTLRRSASLCTSGEEHPANVWDRLPKRAAQELIGRGVELKMGTRVIGVDALGRGGRGIDAKRPDRCWLGHPARRGPGLFAGRTPHSGARRRDRSGRSDCRAAQPDEARSPREGPQHGPHRGGLRLSGSVRAEVMPMPLAVVIAELKTRRGEPSGSRVEAESTTDGGPRIMRPVGPGANDRSMQGPGSAGWCE